MQVSQGLSFADLTFTRAHSCSANGPILLRHHRIMDWLGLEGIPRTIKFQLPPHHRLLDQDSTELFSTPTSSSKPAAVAETQ